jgi:acetyltransferase EpsM
MPKRLSLQKADTCTRHGQILIADGVGSRAYRDARSEPSETRQSGYIGRYRGPFVANRPHRRKANNGLVWAGDLDLGRRTPALRRLSGVRRRGIGNIGHGSGFLIDLIVIGGGEHARVVIDAAQSSNTWRVIGFTDPQPCEKTATTMGVARLGEDSAVAGHPEALLVLGSNSARERIVDRLPGRKWAVIIHACATVSPSAKIGAGAVVLANAVVNPCAQIGEHAIINTGAVIEHDVTVGAFTHVAPAAVIGGGASIGARCFLGLNCCVRDHVQLGDDCIVGMGSVVTRSFPSGQKLRGVPAKASS